ncbi:MAG: hypothetical protein WBE93_15215 [Pseudolabrys sp.]
MDRAPHEFGSVERFFSFLIPINLIHTFMITDELHSVPTNIAGRAGTSAALHLIDYHDWS